MEIKSHTNEQILSAAKEAAVWCQLQWNASEPRSSLRTLNFLPCFFNTDQYYTVNDLIYSRKYEMERLGLKPSNNLSMGKILVYEPDSNISDCVFEGETSGYFDSSDCPPWDTWIGFIIENNQRYVLSWVPNEIIHIVEAGFEVNCVEFFYWLESSSESWALKLKKCITKRSNTPLRGWTVCKSRFCGFARKSISQNHNLQTLLCLKLCAPYQKLHEILPLAGIWRVLSSPTVSQVI